MKISTLFSCVFFKKGLKKYRVSIIIVSSGAKWCKMFQSVPKMSHTDIHRENDRKEEGRMTLLGEYRHALDPKNRLFIPAKFREELGETFYITRKIMEKCLAIYSEAEWQKFSEKLNTLPDSKVGRIKQFVYSKTAQVTPDSHGRILIPATLLSYAEIERNTVIAGIGDHVQVWNEAAWDAKEQELDLTEMEELFCQLGL